MKNNIGFAAIAVIFVLVALIAAVSVGSYFILTNQTTTTPIVTTTETAEELTQNQELPDSQEPVSDSLELDVIEEELNETIVGTPELDFEAMEEDASEL